MEIPVLVPLDDDGFLRRECPACERQFKWFPNTDSAPAPTDGYFCPMCGVQAPEDQSWTAKQVAYAQAVATDEFARMLGDELGADGQAGSGPLRLGVTVDSPGAPPAFLEPNDFVVVYSPTLRSP